jgi:hypothetical protein
VSLTVLLPASIATTIRSRRSPGSSRRQPAHINRPHADAASDHVTLAAGIEVGRTHPEHSHHGRHERRDDKASDAFESYPRFRYSPIRDSWCVRFKASQSLLAHRDCRLDPGRQGAFD